MPLVIIIAVLGTALDQITKLAIAQNIPLGESVTIIDNVLYFTYTHNTGVAFGLFEGAFWLFIPITLLISAGLIWWLIKNRPLHPLMRIASGLILAGGIGNLIDRIFLGYVRDFIHVNIKFAIFNIADSMVVIGAILLGIYVLFIHDKYIKTLKNPQGEKAEACADAAGEESDDSNAKQY